MKLSLSYEDNALLEAFIRRELADFKEYQLKPASAKASEVRNMMKKIAAALEKFQVTDFWGVIFQSLGNTGVVIRKLELESGGRSPKTNLHITLHPTADHGITVTPTNVH
jgi:hypothetical protein